MFDFVSEDMCAHYVLISSSPSLSGAIILHGFSFQLSLDIIHN